MIASLKGRAQDNLGSLHREVSKVQSAIRPRPANAAMRLNPQTVNRTSLQTFEPGTVRVQERPQIGT
eukprot:15476660-Alexandrium_andersonii.AAC.1